MSIMSMISSTTSDNHDDDDDDENENSSSSSSTSTTISTSSLDLLLFQRRRDRIFRTQSIRSKWSRPPYNPLLDDPIDFIVALVQTLQQQQHPSKQQHRSSLPDSYNDDDGDNVEEDEDYTPALCLLESSTPSWRNVLYQSVGFRGDTRSNVTASSLVSPTTTQEKLNHKVAPMLQKAMSKSTSQYAILLSGKTMQQSSTTIQGDQGLVDEFVYWNFPTDPIIDDDDGTCWVEARLRNATNDELLVVTGWSLQKRRKRHYRERENNNNNNNSRSFDGSEEDDDDDMEQQQYSPWLLDGLDWQDFREGFRPGIGREEWERICG